MRNAVDPWIEEPLRTFVSDSGVQLALLLNPTGQVLAQHGFVRALDVMTACALAAAIHASSAELGRQLNGKPFRELHAGTVRQLFIAQAETRQGPYIFLTVFDDTSSLGLVRLYYSELQASLANAAPPPAAAPERVLDVNFEGELNRNLAVLFGKG
jgi:hypothetical protein